MCLHVDDNLLAQAGLTEREALVELACALFKAGRLSLPVATRLSGLTRPEFESALRSRSIPVLTITMDDFRHDLRTLGIPESDD